MLTVSYSQDNLLIFMRRNHTGSGVVLLSNGSLHNVPFHLGILVGVICVLSDVKQITSYKLSIYEYLL